MLIGSWRWPKHANWNSFILRMKSLTNTKDCCTNNSVHSKMKHHGEYPLSLLKIDWSKGLGIIRVKVFDCHSKSTKEQQRIERVLFLGGRGRSLHLDDTRRNSDTVLYLGSTVELCLRWVGTHYVRVVLLIWTPMYAPIRAGLTLWIVRLRQIVAGYNIKACIQAILDTD